MSHKVVDLTMRATVLIVLMGKQYLMPSSENYIKCV
jgi:hypothetical protein